MKWITPKTDWSSNDYVNYTDYNRIKNNIEVVAGMARELYPPFDTEVMADKSVRDYLYADELSTVESNLKSLNTHTVNHNIGKGRGYNDNGCMPNNMDLNRWERATLGLYESFISSYNNRHTLPTHLGMKGDFD